MPNINSSQSSIPVLSVYDAKFCMIAYRKYLTKELVVYTYLNGPKIEDVITKNCDVWEINLGMRHNYFSELFHSV